MPLPWLYGHPKARDNTSAGKDMDHETGTGVGKPGTRNGASGTTGYGKPSTRDGQGKGRAEQGEGEGNG